MLRSETLELCIFNPATVTISVMGRFPRFAMTHGYFRIYEKDATSDLYRIDTEEGESASLEMVTVNELVKQFFPGPDVYLVVEISLPDDVSTQSANLKVNFLTPVLERSPIQNGSDIRCTQTIEPETLSIVGFNIYDRAYQRFMANILNELTTNPNSVKQTFLALRPAVSWVDVYANDLTTDKGIVAVQQGDTCLIGKLGTQTNAQLLLQAQQFFIGPVPIAGVGTIPLWANTGFNVFRTVFENRDVNLVNRFILVGHSLGGAALTFLAAMIRQQFPNKEIFLLSYGCPKPGDNLLLDAIHGIPNCRMENVNDPIPYMPPKLNLLGLPAIAAAGLPIIINMARFVSPPGRVTIMEDGTTIEGDAVDPPALTITSLIVQWLAGGLPAEPAAHDLSFYASQLDL